MSSPQLAPHVRLAFDRARGKPVLLAPESVTTLNDTGAEIVRRCDGRHSVADIIAELKREYADVDAAEVGAFIDRLTGLRCLRAASSAAAAPVSSPAIGGHGEGA
jgi:pyrroloquinoline quinone biosynthesis protein D